MSDTPQQWRVVGEWRFPSELIEVYRDRKATLMLTDAWFDEYSGMGRGHVGHILGDGHAKKLGEVSIHDLNSNLALKFIAVIDEEQERFMRPKWEERERPAVMLARVSKRALERYTPIITRENNKAIAQSGGRARAAKLSPKRRSQIARKGGLARWKCQRLKRKVKA